MNQPISDKGVCRPAPATSGLLIDDILPNLQACQPPAPLSQPARPGQGQERCSLLFWPAISQPATGSDKDLFMALNFTILAKGSENNSVMIT